MTAEEFNTVIKSRDIETLRNAGFELREEISGIQSQTTEAVLNQSARFRSEWFAKANYALQRKKNQLRQINCMIDAIHSEAKAKRRQRHDDTREIQNHLFYTKLKELMSPSELAAFMVECERIIENEGVTDDDTDNEL